MKQNHRKHVYLSFFNPLKVTGKLEIESLGWVHGGELGGGELAMGRNWYHSETADEHSTVFERKLGCYVANFNMNQMFTKVIFRIVS